MFKLTADNLGKRFGERKVFSEIAFELSTGDSLAVTGPNGSGKSTLIMLLLGYHHATRGEVGFHEDNEPLSDSQIRSQTSLVSPYLNLYDHLTGEENLTFFATVSGGHVTGKRVDELLALVGLEGRGVDMVGSYSSGMKQRLKYAAALLNEPAFLFLDEPTSNLDDRGKGIVAQIVEEYRKKSIVVVATNEKEELSFASQICRLGQ
ncbi:MAG: ABC transporter ATP-binding protein [bacterium]|nr:ABC transporter ATP-binding protein [bacterium]